MIYIKYGLIYKGAIVSLLNIILSQYQSIKVEVQIMLLLSGRYFNPMINRTILAIFSGNAH